MNEQAGRAVGGEHLQPWSVRPEPAPVLARARPDGEVTRDDVRRMILDELRELVGK